MRLDDARSRLPLPPGPGGLRVLALAASNIVEDVAVLVETVTTTVEETKLVTDQVTEVQTCEEMTREVEVESIETRTSEELGHQDRKSTEPMEVTESTTQKNHLYRKPHLLHVAGAVPAVPGLPLPQAPIELPRELLLPALVGGRGAAGHAREPGVRFGSGGPQAPRGRARRGAGRP